MPVEPREPSGDDDPVLRSRELLDGQGLQNADLPTEGAVVDLTTTDEIWDQALSDLPK